SKLQVGLYRIALGYWPGHMDPSEYRSTELGHIRILVNQVKLAHH
ncbi:7834_t:CDS:1, partial [Gigaspora margarita]